MNDRPGTIAALGLLVAGIAWVGISHAHEVLDPERPAWQRLRFEASKLFITATTDIYLEAVDSRKAAGDLEGLPTGEPRQPGALTQTVRIETSVLGRKSTETVWFDPVTGHSLQRLKLRHGSKTYQKLVRFGHQGVVWRRSAPADSREAEGPRSAWSDRHETWHALPAGVDCSLLIDPSELFYLLAARQWQPGDREQMCVFSGESYSRVTVEATDRRPIEVDYASGDKRRKGKIKALRLTVGAEPLGANNKFEMMGFEGDVEFFLDLKTGLPVQISGRLEKLGQVDVRLIEHIPS